MVNKNKLIVMIFAIVIASMLIVVGGPSFSISSQNWQSKAGIEPRFLPQADIDQLPVIDDCRERANTEDFNEDPLDEKDFAFI